MTVIAVPPLTDAPTSPDRADRTTFTARSIVLDEWRKNFNVPEMRLALANVFANAVDAFNSATAAAASAAAALASQAASALNATAAAASAGATVWTVGTYTVGTRKYSPINQRLYKCKTGGAGATDPALDGANWDPIDVSAIILPLAGTTGTVYAGVNWSLDNAGAMALTLDASIPDSGEFSLTLKNGRLDNTLDIGTKTLFGPNGNITGVIVLDTQARAIRFKYFAATTSLEIMN